MKIDRSMYKDGKTAVFACAKDEGPWILEWVAHYLSLGFDKVAIATNDCSDGTDKICQRLQELGYLVHIDNPPPYDEISKVITGKDMKPSLQEVAYHRLEMHPELYDCEWVTMQDLDEFLVIHEGDGSIQALINKYPKVEAILVNWKLFGDNGLKGMIEPPIADKLTSCSSTDDPRNDHTCVIVRYPHDKLLSPHYPMTKIADYRESRFKKAMYTAHRKYAYIFFSYDGRYFKIKRSASHPDYQDFLNSFPNTNVDAQVNHYALRTHEICMLKKLRGTANDAAEHWQVDDHYHYISNRNEETDTSIQKYKKKRDGYLAKFLADSELSRLHKASIELTKTNIIPFAYNNKHLNNLRTAPKVTKAEIGKVNSKDIKTIVVLAPYGSGSSAVTGYIDFAGAYSCPPIYLTRDKKTDITFEPHKLAHLLRGQYSQMSLKEKPSAEKFIEGFKTWHKEQVAKAKAAGSNTIVIKHALLCLAAHHIDEIIDAKYVVVNRPLHKIEATKNRRGWRDFFGKKSAKKLYKAAHSFLKESNKNFVTVDFEKFVRDENERKLLLENLGLEPDLNDLELAEEYIRKS